MLKQIGLNLLKANPILVVQRRTLLLYPFGSREEMDNAYSYTQTRFFHLMLTLKKNTQHTSRSVYALVPQQDFSCPWSDDKLFKKYDLDNDEINFIQTMVKPD